MNEKTRTIVFNLSALLLLVGAGLYLALPAVAPYLFAVGAAGYAVCQCSDCPRASVCLRQIAYSLLIDDEKTVFLRLIKPQCCSQDDRCAYFRDSTPVVFARGFVNFQERMFPKQYDRFMTKLIALFGRNAYFERRRGQRPLPPEEQAAILSVLREVGVDAEYRFDAYEERTL